MINSGSQLSGSPVGSGRAEERCESSLGQTWHPRSTGQETKAFSVPQKNLKHFTSNGCRSSNMSLLAYGTGWDEGGRKVQGRAWVAQMISELSVHLLHD